MGNIWQIDSLCKKDSNQHPEVLKQLDRFFIEKNIKTEMKDADTLIVFQDLAQYQITFKNDEDSSVLSIQVETEDETVYNIRQYPLTVSYIQDFFKSGVEDWYYLETLCLQELALIKKNARTISPLDIKSRIESQDQGKKFRRPQIGKLGHYDYGQKDFYHGSKEDYKDVVEFWVSTIAWVGFGGDMEYWDMSNFQSSTYFNNYFGICIPEPVYNMQAIIETIVKHIPHIRQEDLKGAYLMRENWDDKRYLFDFENNFVMYNWWTGE